MKTFQISWRVALFFFVVGSILFVLQLVTSTVSWLPIMGLYYVLISVFINAILVFALVTKLITEAEKVQTLKSIGVILLNAPIAYSYIQILFTYAFI